MGTKKPLVCVVMLIVTVLLACCAAQGEDTHNAAAGANIVLAAPVVVSQGPAELRKWGPWQFPAIQRLPDGRLQIGFHIGEDSATAYGTEPGVAVSEDNGQTWKEVKAGEESASCAAKMVRLPNGDLLRAVQMKSRKLEEVAGKLPPPLGTWMAEAGTQEVILYAGEKTPKEFAGWRFARLTKGGTAWVEETAEVRIPGEVRIATSGVFTLPWMQRIQVAPDGTLWGINHGLRVVGGKVRTPLAVQLLHSTDGGRVWNLVGEIPYQPDKKADKAWNTREGFTEPNIAFFPDRSILCLIRSTDGSIAGPLYMSRSTDNGKTWSKPSVFDTLGVYPALLTLTNGVTLASYGRPGLYIRASGDPAGKLWGPRVTVVQPGEWGKDTCSYSDMIAMDDHTALIVYSDYNYPDSQGVPRKTILVRKVTVSLESAVKGQ
jgi:hypothetical protein